MDLSAERHPSSTEALVVGGLRARLRDRARKFARRALHPAQSEFTIARAIRGIRRLPRDDGPGRGMFTTAALAALGPTVVRTTANPSTSRCVAPGHNARAHREHSGGSTAPVDARSPTSRRGGAVRHPDEADGVRQAHARDLSRRHRRQPREPVFVIGLPGRGLPLASVHARSAAQTALRSSCRRRSTPTHQSSSTTRSSSRPPLAQRSSRPAATTKPWATDADYVGALEFGLPPPAACGIGTDRV